MNSIERFLASKYWFHYFHDNCRREVVYSYLYLLLSRMTESGIDRFCFSKWTKDLIMVLALKRKKDGLIKTDCCGNRKLGAEV